MKDKKKLHIWDLLELKSFKSLEKPLQITKGLKILGYFPYEKAYIRGDDVIRLGIEVFKSLEDAIRSKFPINNKIVIVLKETTEFNTRTFAYYIKDGLRSIGSLNSLTDYEGGELK